jgi:tRNA(Arg) A34 adenosine deaminase TadA
MVQARIRKVYYFPSMNFEIDWEDYCTKQEMGLVATSPTRNKNQTLEDRIKEKKEINISSVSRLIANNLIAISKYIPVWGVTVDNYEIEDAYWKIDESITKVGAHSQFYEKLLIEFKSVVFVLKILEDSYKTDAVNIISDKSLENVELYRHAMVLAHIASKRTDDAKVGVGAVLVQSDGTYESVGWNGFPTKAGMLMLIMICWIIHKLVLMILWIKN